MQVFGLLNIVIERMGEDILPQSQAVLSLLPQIWHDAHDQSLLRIQVGVRNRHIEIVWEDAPPPTQFGHDTSI